MTAASTTPRATAPPPWPAPAQAWTAREYPQTLRGPWHRWWRPLVGILLVVVSGGLLILVAGVSLALYSFTSGTPMTDLAAPSSMADPTYFLINNLLLAAAIPVCMLAVRLAHGWPVGFLTSVVGRFRWGVLGRALAVAGGVYLLDAGVSVLLAGGSAVPEPNWPALIAVMVLTTPLQAAGEEYFFRGWLTQALGSWIPWRWVALAAPLVVSSILFGLAHGEQNFWLIADRCIIGVVLSLLVWRTGGLECAVVLHTLVNVEAFSLSTAYGGMGQIMAVTRIGPLDMVVDLAPTLLAAALLWWWASRAGPRRRTQAGWDAFVPRRYRRPAPRPVGAVPLAGPTSAPMSGPTSAPFSGPAPLRSPGPVPLPDPVPQLHPRVSPPPQDDSAASPKHSPQP